MSTTVIVVAKAPEPGRAKTRLAAGIGDEAASSLAAAFLADVFRTVASLDARCVFAWAGDLAHPAFEPARELGFEFVRQPDGDLGERLAQLIADQCERSEHVLVVGSDSPTLQALHFDEALEALKDHDVVVGPSFDGGYYLLGVRAAWYSSCDDEPVHPLFADVDWSTSSVLGQTLRRCRQLGALCELIRFCYDVDTPEDLELLRTHLLEYLRPSGLDVARKTAILLSNTPTTEANVGDQ